MYGNAVLETLQELLPGLAGFTTLQDGQVTVCRICPAYRCDRYVKKALQSRTLLAWFLHSGFPQLFAGSIPEIAASLVKSTGAIPDATADSLTDTEKNDPIHGQVLFDSLVISIQESNNGEKVYVIDVEVQNCLSSARFLIGRSLYYYGRLTTAQKNDKSGFVNDHYEDLKPVAELWVFPAARQSMVVTLDDRLTLDVPPADNSRLAGSLQAAAAGMMEIRFVFVGENWRTYIENPEIRNFGLLFREPETDRRLEELKKAGVKMTVEEQDALKDTFQAFDYELWMERLHKFHAQRMAALEEEYRLKGEALQKHEYSLRKKEEDLRKESEDLRKESEDLRRKEADLEKQSRELEDRQQNMIRQLSRTTGLSSVEILNLLNQE